MDLFRYIVRFLYKIRWYLVILPLIALIVAWFSTRNMERIYDTNTTIYTGMITGYNIEGATGGGGGGNAQTNIANLMLIVTTDATIHEVSLRLFARCMMYGNTKKDNNYISAEHFRQLNSSVPADVKALINRNDEKATYANLKAYEKPTQDNYLFGILNYHPWFGINSITSRLKVMQLPKSDIIDIGYSANDAGIAYNTLDILNDVFGRQYQDLRYGETNAVIKFFEREVARLYKLLTGAEDDLIRYNVDRRIINYGEQTKMVADMDAKHKTSGNDQLMAYTTSKAMLDYLERQLGNRAKIIRANRDFTAQINDISRIQSRISNLKLMNSEGGASDEAQIELAKAEKKLQETTAKVKDLTLDIEAGSYSSETGVKAGDMINKWLEQVLILEKTKAEISAQDIMRQKLDKDILYYAPIGATIARKDRHISFIEGNYMEMLKALNQARLRQRNLQMSTATLRVLNPPMFPMNAQPTNRMMILLGAFMLTFLFTAMYFFIIELLDRTLRDRMRSERITKIPVMGCFPKESNLRYRRYNKTISDMALRQLSKSLLPHFKEGQQNVLNLLSTDAANGKSYLAQELQNYWISIGLHVRLLTYDEDFLAEDSKYIMAKDVKDLCPDLMPNEIAIIEYPNLDDNSISPALLNTGTINLLVTRANRTWKDVDQKALKELQAQLENKDSLYMYLTEAQRYAVEEFVGQLPPYTRFNNFVYRISQMGLTAVENSHAK